MHFARVGIAEALPVEFAQKRQVDAPVLPGLVQLVRCYSEWRECRGGLGLEKTETLGELAGDEVTQRDVVDEDEEAYVAACFPGPNAQRNLTRDDGDFALEVHAVVDVHA